MGLAKSVEYAMFGLISVIMLLWGFIEGLSPVTRSLDLFFFVVRISTIEALYSSIGFSLTTLFACFLLYKELHLGEKREPVNNSDPVEAIVPVYRDHNVLHKSVESLQQSNYNDLRINVVCEEGDERSIEAAEKLDCEVVINKYPGSKAGAINTVFEERDSKYFAIFDADEVVSEDFIGHGIGYLKGTKYMVFQGRRVPIPDGLVEKFSYCERAIFHAAYKLQGLLGFPYAKSSSTILTDEAWEKANGYDDMLTEDIDFAHKCWRHDIPVKSDRRYTNLMEAPHTWKDFWNQRKRWLMGVVQIFHKGLKRDYRESPRRKEVFSLLRSFFSFTFPILILILFSNFFVLVVLGLQVFYLLPILVTALAPIIVSASDRKIEGIDFIGFFSLFTFIILLVSGLIALKAALEYVFSWNGEWYLVEKGK
ncbi:MAG: cellulose synthase/poly-beta-1,6-N-acetylglucosamine synthase-like glycosyltransferase [Candidatus Nanohaloarchaea archaeon]|jgi:cellulose synthase/poly-beta-1,6-N-acetylglucosamine synthase-like glycosyltransferase